MPAEGGNGGVGGGSVGGTAQVLRTFRKGPFLTELDKRSREASREDAENVRKALEQIRDKPYPAGLEQVIAAQLPGTHPDDRKHVKKHWLEDWEHPWQAEGVLVNGLIKAIQAAIEGSPDPERILPFDCYWVSGAGSFEMVVTRSDRQVNVLIFTPPIGGPVFGDSYPIHEEVWSIRKGALKSWESEEHKVAGVITTQLKQRPPGGGTGG